MAVALDEQVIKGIIWFLYFVGIYFTLFWLSVLLSRPQPNSSIKRTRWPEVSVILPMYNEEKHVEWTLDSVFGLDYDLKKIHVFCVNDGSTDNTMKILRKLKKKYNFTIIDKPNGGKHTAINAALDKIVTPYFAVLDVDCYVEPDALKNLLQEFDSSDVASVMPIMKVNKPQNLLQRVQWLEYLINTTYKHIMGKIDCIHVVPGPFSIYRTDYVKKLGCFKKAHMTEDLEMALRLQNNHYKLKQSMSAVVHTNSPKTLKAFVSQRTRWYQGTLLNVADYKHFLFNKKYGDFGFFHMPMVSATGILAMIGVFTLLYLSLKQFYHTLKKWYLTNFDFWTYITNYRWNTTFLDLDWQTIFLTFMVFMLLILFVYIAFAATKIRVSVMDRTKSILMFAYYLFVYNILMGYIWAKVVYKLVLRKSNKWDKVN